MSNATIESVLSFPRFRRPSAEFVTLARLAGVKEDADVIRGLSKLRSELGRLAPGGEFSKVDRSTKGFNAKVDGERIKEKFADRRASGEADFPLCLAVVEITIAVDKLASLKGQGFPVTVTPTLGEEFALAIRLYCGVKPEAKAPEVKPETEGK